MKTSQIKNQFICSSSLSPAAVIEQGCNGDKGRLLIDILRVIQKSQSTDEMRKFHTRVRLIAQEAKSLSSILKKSMKGKIQKKIDKLAQNILRQDYKETQTQAKKTLSSSLVPRGFQNGGNTCYLNAVLKFLLGSEKIQSFLHEQDRGKKNTFAHSLKKLTFCAQEKPHFSQPISVTSHVFASVVKKVQKFFPDLKTKIPQDASELLRPLLRRIGYPLISCECVERGVRGELRREIQEHDLIPLHLHALPVELGSHGSLQDLIDRSCSMREIGRMAFNVTTQLKLHQEASETLFFHLIRGEDEERPIRGTECLRLSVQDSIKTLLYQLRTVCIFAGGHYFTYEKTARGWLKHNDSSVQPVKEEEAIRDISLRGMLFCYEQI